MPAASFVMISIARVAADRSLSTKSCLSNWAMYSKKRSRATCSQVDFKEISQAEALATLKVRLAGLLLTGVLACLGDHCSYWLHPGRCCCHICIAGLRLGGGMQYLESSRWRLYCLTHAPGQ